jgi:hypothetical protein
MGVYVDNILVEASKANKRLDDLCFETILWYSDDDEDGLIDLVFVLFVVVVVVVVVFHG